MTMTVWATIVAGVICFVIGLLSGPIGDYIRARAQATRARIGNQVLPGTVLPLAFMQDGKGTWIVCTRCEWRERVAWEVTKGATGLSGNAMPLSLSHVRNNHDESEK